jgi:hypothetical protein
VNDPLDPDERWFAHLLASIPAPASLDTWTPSGTPVARPAPRRRSRARPLAVALAVAVLVGLTGAGIGLIAPGHGGAPASSGAVPGVPVARIGAGLATDPQHDRVVLFGGDAGAALLADTWTWDGHRWSRQPPAAILGPAARRTPGMAADLTGGGVLLFGGAGAEGALGDTWRWDGRLWKRLRPRTSPPPSAAPLMAADPSQRGTLLVVPATAASAPAGTWSWDGSDWTRRPTAVAPPSCPSAMTVDPADGRVLLVTGRSCPAGGAGATWTWDGRSWARQHPAVSPAADDHAALGDDGAGHPVLYSTAPDPVHSCAPRLTWAWVAGAWMPHAAAASPSTSGVAAADPAGNDLLLFTASGETWTWNGSAWQLGESGAPARSASPAGPWSQRSPAVCPPARTGAAVATDGARRQVVVFGGSASPLDRVPPVLADTWIWDGMGWSERHPNPSPPARTGAVAAYDAAHAEVVLFGGVGLDDTGAPVPFTATWTWDGAAWHRRSPRIAPPGLRLASMAWDGAGRRVLLVTAAAPEAAQTWAWDGSAWTQLHPRTTPPFGSLVAAPGAGGLLLVSPAGPDGRPSTWSWDGGDWHRLPVAGTPSAAGAAVAYEASAHRVVLLAGDCPAVPATPCRSASTWTFDGHTWTRLPLTASPPPRAGAALVPDPATGALLLVGGTTGTALLGDTWEFS